MYSRITLFCNPCHNNPSLQEYIVKIKNDNCRMLYAPKDNEAALQDIVSIAKKPLANERLGMKIIAEIWPLIMLRFNCVSHASKYIISSSAGHYKHLTGCSALCIAPLRNDCGMVNHSQ